MLFAVTAVWVFASSFAFGSSGEWRSTSDHLNLAKRNIHFKIQWKWKFYKRTKMITCLRVLVWKI